MREPRLLPHLDVLVDLERQRRGLVEDLDAVGDHLDVAGGQGRVLVPLRPAADVARDAQHELVAQAVGDGFVADHDLDDARGVAEVEERHPAVVAAPGHPSREGDGPAGVPARRLPASSVRSTWCLALWSPS